MWWWQRRRKQRTVTIKGKKGVVYSRLPLVSAVLLSVALLFWVSSILIFTIPVFPAIWYRLQPGTSQVLAQVLRRPAVSLEDVLVESGEKEIFQPPIDESLPQQNMLIIDKIGVNTAIIENSYEDYEEALKLGVWRVPDFGDPFNRKYPTILAAHRFGYLAWSNQYRRQNSFYNLPKLEVGDRVEVIWGQRKYVYEIYHGDEGEEVTDYSADLIVYTCRFLESDIRIFRYARLVEV